MRVALCTEVMYPVYGVEKRVEQIAVLAKKYGFEIDLYTTSHPQDLPYLNIIQTSKPTITDPPKRNYAFLVRYWYELYKKLSKEKYDIIDANGHPTLVPCSLAGLRTKTPVVGTLHDLYLGNWKQMTNSSLFFTGPFFEVISAKMPVTKMLTLNSKIRDRIIKLLKYDKEKISVLPSGIHVDEIDSVKQPKKSQTTILYVGRLTPQKDVPTLIRAFALTKKEYKLKILGEGFEKPKLQALCKQLKVNERVEFIKPYKNHRDMVREIKAAAVLVLPSIRECFGIVPLESMAAGTPIISTKTDGPNDYIKNGVNGFLTEIGDEKELAKRIEELLEDRVLHKKFTARGRKTAEAYDWEIIVKRIVGVYRNITKS